MATVISTGEKIVCHCLRVTESEIQDAVNAGLVESVRCAMKQTGAGGGCTSCHASIKRLIAAGKAQSSSPTCVTR